MSSNSSANEFVNFPLESGTADSSLEVITDTCAVIDLDTPENEESRGSSYCKCLRCDEDLLNRYLQAIETHEQVGDSLLKRFKQRCINENGTDSDEIAIKDEAIKGNKAARLFLQHQLDS